MVAEEMKIIKLNKGKIALVDDEDYVSLQRYHWFVSNAKSGLEYATARVRDKKILMHRLILNFPKNMVTDHKNGNGLDNCRSNLRTCTQQQNCFNRRVEVRNTSGFKGVVWNRKGKKWQSRIKINGKRIYLGLHIVKEDAALAYNTAAIKYFGAFARLNEIT